MKEAKARNPRIRLYGLPWDWPGWIATNANSSEGQLAQCANSSAPAAQKGQWCSTGGRCTPSPADNYPGHGDGNTSPCDPFSDNARTASYVTSWVGCAKHSHNLTIDWVGIWNESPWNPDYILELRRQLDAAGLQATRIIGGDGDIIDIAKALQQNASVAHAVDALGTSLRRPLLLRCLCLHRLACSRALNARTLLVCAGRHYPGYEGNDPANRIPSELGIPLWASEDYSTYSDANGAGCWARSLVLNAVNNYTATISWYLLGAFSRGVIYDSDGFIRAEWPKSGHWEPTPMLWMTQHWSRFVSGGEAHFIGTGDLQEGGKYAGLQSDDGAVTVVVEAMTWNASLCIRSNPPFYTVAPTQNVSLHFPALAGAKGKPMAVYCSCIGWRYGGGGDQSPSYFQRISDAHASANGTLVLADVRADCVYTATTRSSLLGAAAEPAALPARPPPAAFALPHADSFDDTRTDGNEALYFSDMLGKFELGPAAGGRSSQAMQQAVTAYLPISGNCPAHFYPISLIGDMFAEDANITVDVYLPEANSAGFVAHRTREWHNSQRDGAFRTRVPGVFLWLGPTAGVGKSHWRMCTDNNCTGPNVVLGSGIVAAAANSWHRLSLAVNGSSASASLDGTALSQDVKLPPSAPNEHTARSEDPGSLDFPTGHVAGSGWSAIGSTFAGVQFDNFLLAGMHDGGASAVRSCPDGGAAEAPARGRAVESYPCDRPGASTRWVVRHGVGHVQHGLATELCMAAAVVGEAVTLQPCTSSGVLRFVNATGRVVTKEGDKCLTIQPAVGSYPGGHATPAKAVLSECLALPANRQQFQFSVRRDHQ